MRPGLGVDLSFLDLPEPSPEAVRERALAVTREWLASLDHPPTAEEILMFAESYAGRGSA